MNIISEKSGFVISTDKDSIDYQKLHYFLAFESYWAPNIPMDILKKGISNSINYSMIEKSTNKFIGFARLITDKATFAYLSDVFIDKEYRRRSLGKWLIETILDNPDVKGLRLLFLMTKDAQTLYNKFGFKSLEKPEMAMAIRKSPKELYPPLNESK